LGTLIIGTDYEYTGGQLVVENENNEDTTRREREFVLNENFHLFIPCHLKHKVNNVIDGERVVWQFNVFSESRTSYSENSNDDASDSSNYSEAQMEEYLKSFKRFKKDCPNQCGELSIVKRTDENECCNSAKFFAKFIQDMTQNDQTFGM
jgi:hypothetical protein